MNFMTTPPAGIRASTDRHVESLRLTSISIHVRPTTPEENVAIAKKIARQREWMKQRARERDAEEARAAIERAKAAREFFEGQERPEEFDDDDLPCFLRPQAG